MRSLIIFLTVLGNWKVNAFAKPVVEHSNGPIENHTFVQPLDHFDPENNAQWEQRYSSNREFVTERDDTPIFLRVNGESPYQPAYLLVTAWNEWAKQYGAMMYILEHRFFGQSYPTDDLSTENLKYLTTQQALADIANFIQEMNKKNGYTSKNKWILFGGSYSGALVAWARLNYPDVIFGSVSSSAPLQAVADNPKYNDIVLEQLNLYSPGCGEAFNQGITFMKETFESGSESDINDMLDQFSICSSFNSSSWQDRVLFYKGASAQISSVVQYNSNPGMPHANITQECNDFLVNTDIGDPIDRLIARYQARTSFKAKGTCNDVSYDRYVKSLQEDDRSSSLAGTRAWYYLLCNELGYSQTSSTKKSLYSDVIPLKFYTEQCRDIFGEEFGEERMMKGTEENRKRNQGVDIKVTNVAFVQGSVDPWHSLGMITNPTEDSPQIYIDGPVSYHCSDMDGHAVESPDYREKALQEIGNNIKKWLS